MERFIAKENIRRFKAQLASCTDDRERNALQQLLSAEERKLIDLERNAVTEICHAPTLAWPG